MPRRKSRKRQTHLQGVPTSSLSAYNRAKDAKERVGEPYEVIELVPSNSIPQPRRKYASRDEVIDIIGKYDKRVHLIEKRYRIEDGAYLPASSALLPGGNDFKTFMSLDKHLLAEDVLLATEAVPKGDIAVSRSPESFSELSSVDEDFALFESLGASKALDQLVFLSTSLADVDMYGENATSITGGIFQFQNEGAATDFPEKMIYQGENVSSRVAQWINERFLASEMLNCCYIGRGAPTGVNIKDQIESILADKGIVASFIDVVTSGQIDFPYKEAIKLGKWQKETLWQNWLSTSYKIAIKQSENFRLDFHFTPYLFKDEQMLDTARVMQGIRHILQHVLIEYERGKDNNIPDIIWTDGDSAEQMRKRLDDIGARSAISAYLSGVPLEDIIA